MTVGILRKAGVAALAAILALVGLIPLASGAGATASFDLTRLNGEDRFGTAAAIATATFPNGADTVLIARADLFPDALAGNYLAGDRTAPILLSRVDAAPQETMTALQTLKAKNVILLGREQALSAAVAAQLTSAGYTVTRIGGEDRYETASLIAREPGAANVGTRPGTQAPGGRKTAIIANGLNFPDALAAGPISYKNQFPILLTLPNQLVTVTRETLGALGIQHVIIVGETEAVSNEVKNAIEGLNITTERLGGATRYDTAQQIANFAITVLNFSNAHINVARGDDFADALTGGPHAGQENAVIILTEPLNVPTATRTFVQGLASTVATGHIFGGFTAVSQQVENDLETAGGRTTQGGTSVTLTNSSVQQGGTVTGTITGENIQSVTVSGCGLTSQQLGGDTDPNTAGRQFSIVVPSNQPAGSCTLTFTITRTDGTTVTETETVTVTSANAQAGVTAAPELVRAESVQFITNPGANAAIATDDFQQVEVRFVFDEPIVGQTPVANLFHLVTFNNNRFDGQSQRPDPQNTSAVIVTFGVAGNEIGQTGGTNRTAFSDVTLATVDFDAVEDANNNPNPIGDAAIGTATQTRTAGVTAAPDLLAVENPRAAPGGAANTLVDFTFDENAFVINSAGFHLVLRRQGEGQTVDVVCTAPAFNAPTDGTNAGGGTVIGGNGSTRITVSCPIGTNNGGQQITLADIARGYVDPFTVADAQQDAANANTEATAEGNENPLQASNTPDAATDTPDLVSVQFFPNATLNAGTTQVDQAIYTFDQAVTINNTANFFAYDTAGNEIQGQTANGAITQAPQVNTQDQRQVIVTFANGQLDDAVGASVEQGAVISQAVVNGVTVQNEEDEVGVQNQSTTTQAGRTTAPDLTNVVIGVTRDVAGNVTGSTVTYVFDEDVDVADFTKLRLYTPNGTQLFCIAATAANPTAEDTDNTVTCTQFDVTTAGGTDATQAQIQSAVLGAADDRAVAEEGATLAGAPPTTPVNAAQGNPEGAVPTTGGTGTPTS